MLNANKISNFLTVFLVCSLSYASDVSKFDVKDVKLGMSKNEVLKKMPCNNPKEEIERTNSGKIYKNMIICGSNRSRSYSAFNVIFDHKDHVFYISKFIPFNIKPNLAKIETRLISKYGEPDARTELVPGYKNPNKYVIKTFCWGSCKIKYSNDRYSKGSEIAHHRSRPQLEVTYTESSEELYLSFSLEDPVRDDENYKWNKKENVKFRIQQKRKASNIDF